MTVISHMPRFDRYNLDTAAPLSAKHAPVAEAEAAHLTDETPQAKGDRDLATLYAQVLKRPSSADQDVQKMVVENIPATSSFGQRQAFLREILDSPAMKNWAELKNIKLSDRNSIDISNGTLIVPGAFGFGAVDLTDFAGWPMLKSVATALAGSGNFVGTGNTATIEAIAQFYGQTLPVNDSRPFSEQKAILTAYADQIVQDPTFTTGDSSPPLNHDLHRHQSQLAELNNRGALSSALSKILSKLEVIATASILEAWENGSLEEPDVVAHQATQKLVQDFIAKGSIEIDPRSSYFRDHNLKPGVAVPLRDFLSDQGFVVPASYQALKFFLKALGNLPPEKAAHGNLGGALSSPTQLDNDHQRTLDGVIKNILEEQPETTLLEYLTRDLEWDPKTFSDDPRHVIDDIFKSANAQNLGYAAEREIGELASPEPINDWVMAALYVALDNKSVFTDPPISTRTKVAGFDLADIELSGKSASYIRKALADYLIEKKIATPKTVDLALFILLSRKAPELLVKDIPESLTFGSHAWVSFATAVARIEAQAPGSTSKMTYAEVMMRGDLVPITLVDKLVEQHAQGNALKDWGISNGVLVGNPQDEYTSVQLQDLRSAFSKQVSELSAASRTFAAPLPDLHKRALWKLKRLNPHLSEEQLTKKTLDPKSSGFLEFPGPYSILEVFLTTRKDYRPVYKEQFTSRDDTIDLDELNTDIGTSSHVRWNFEYDLREYFDNFEAAAKAQTKYLISKLPLEDRDIIENGKITLAIQRNAYRGLTGLSITKHSPTLLTVQSEYKGKTHAYEIDLVDNAIFKRPDWKRPASLPSELLPGLTSGVIYEAVTPSGEYRKGLTEATSPDAPLKVPDSYFSEKSQYIANALVEEIDIRQLEGELRGTTTFETEVAAWKTAGNFVLGLIPFYNAINNFAAGNTRDGVIDLAFDALGFVLSGVTASLKGVKAVAAAGTAASRGFGQVAKKLARTAIGALNPIDPVGFGLASVQEVLNHHGVLGGGDMKLPRSFYKYDVVKTFRGIDNATIGKATMQGAMEDVAATQKNGKWYALDPVSKQPYGLPLKDFVPSP